MGRNSSKVQQNDKSDNPGLQHVRLLSDDDRRPAISTQTISPSDIFQRCRFATHMEYHFTGLPEKIHGSAKDFEPPRLQMPFQISLGIPFFEKAEFVFIIHFAEKIAPAASFFCPYQTGQGIYRLGQFLVLLRKNFHADNEEDHAKHIANGLPIAEKMRNSESSFQNRGLD
jgi:hypothetical protein